MAQQLMWDQIEAIYRGQATNSALVTVEQDAMDVALRKAGKVIYDSDWWLETLQNVLEHWGIYGKRWVDPATQLQRVHFTLGEPRKDTDSGQLQQETPPAEGTRTGPLTERLISGKLTTRDLTKDNK
jgi:hypothetical protein